MENKYFTPDIEDIRVGYECEFTGWLSEYKEVKITQDNLSLAIGNIAFLKVPYLTKEHIEAEGWIRQDNYIDENKQQRIGLVPDYELKTSFGSLRLFIKDFNKPYEDISIEKYTKSDSHNPWSLSGKWFVYRGKCKDPNTFRYICKLLGV